MQGSVSAHIEDHEDPSSAEWEDSLAAVLARLGVRRLKDAARVLSDAPQDRDPEAGEDQYYVVRAEGMEYDSEVKGDELEPGMQFAEAAQVIHAALSLLPCLDPDTPLVRDEPFNQEMLPARKPDANRTLGDLRVPYSQDAEVNAQRGEDRAASRDELVAALQRAAGGQPIYLTLITYEDAAQETLEQALRQLFYLEQVESFPNTLNVSFARLGPGDMHLIAALDRRDTPRRPSGPKRAACATCSAAARVETCGTTMPLAPRS